MYATNSSEAPTETSCLCSSAKNNSNRAHGSGRAITYSNLISSTADYNLRSGIYTSPYLHRCAVQVDVDTEYICNVGGRENAAHFITPPAAGKYPRVDPDQSDGIFSFAVIADGGQTRYSNATYHGALSWLRAKRASTLLYAGDLAYSDGEPLRWDSFGRLAEPLLSSVVTMWAPGNHELSAQEAYGGYLDRYGSTARELWFAERRGPVHFLSLCSYCRTEPGSAQFRWLELELERASQGRDKTPWIIVQFHAPFYCSNPSHHEKAKPMRTGMEPLFVEHHVDLVISGHVHAYERTTPMQYGRPSTCGPTYVVVGDGGNREKASPFLRIGALAPSWSAFRQSSFGFASMEIQNATHANWTWHRNPHDFDHFPEQPITPLGSFAREDAVVMDRTDCRA
ncbi:Purple acid phosphatase [Hondaea fermentalgiana]|uniref:Purple acid phosphatase n=1 Tax=Hondaea fermentalgiana TaxID=2315210 RepID=A0A2R5G286_9STRA|nr:Purple acid phosphatase [Hondaea fermentalgiana]|eukprot:GBG25126.1 Purple acid phosphatase [Hondaea fermentalgiana]